MSPQPLDLADALLSAPDDHLHPVFDNERSVSPAALSTASPSVVDLTEPKATQPPQEGEKKPAKKRKSWGQELPTPKTNLPPRKRAKTEDEKEQRRIERVLRNRAAAQSSRERKRKEVEGLEEEKEAIRRQNALLTSQLRRVEMENQELSKTIAKMAAEMSVFRQMIHGDLPTPPSDVKAVSPTLSSDLMPPSEPVAPPLKQELVELDFSLPPPQSTVDPRDASFSSPADSPQPEPLGAVPDLTQHPAVSVGGGLAAMDHAGGPASVPDHYAHRVASPLSDNGFDRLFSPGPALGGDLPLFADGLPAVDGGDGVGGDAFSFDALVDFDADQPFIALGGDDDDPVVGAAPPPPRPSHHLSDPLAAATPGLQPGFGAPFEGRDGPGIAADV